MENNFPQVTVTVVYRNEESNLKSLLESFRHEMTNLEGNPFKFLFVDNHSSDQSSRIIEESWLNKKYGHTELIVRNENHMAEARQEALKTATTPWILFLDADTLLKENWVKSVLRIVNDAQENELVIGGGEEAFGDKEWHAFARSLANYFPMGKTLGKKVQVDHVPTNNCLMRREKALEVGGFNSFFGRVGEDFDLSVRMRREGKIIYYPNFPVKHRLPESITSWFQKMALYGRAQTYVLLENKGGVPYEKFFPFLFLVLFIWFLKLYPIEVGAAFTFLVMIPRTQFFILTFMFYGLGEFVGFFRFFLLKMSLKSSQTLTDRVS